MKYLSLFSGIGGFELGIQYAHESICNVDGSEDGGEQENSSYDERQRFLAKERKKVSSPQRPTCECSPNGIDERPLCIGYSEIDKYAIQIYQKHFNHKNYGDITKINENELPDFDFLCGGFPCQSFSIAGKRGGFNDTRGTLFFDIARILKAKQPRLLLLENVKGLLSHDEGRTFATIIATLDELGYDLQWQVLNSKNFGVPQNRERVFIVGHLRGTSRPKVFPIGETTTENVGQLEKRKINVVGTTVGNGKGTNSRHWVHRTTGIIGAVNATEFKQPKQIIEEESAKIRRLTPTECMRLQGFPDNWCDGVSDTQKYKCAGNAVTVNVIQAIMERLL